MSKKANIKITYVKLGDGVEIHYEERRENGMGTIKFESDDKPRKSFVDAFAALKEHVIEMCECPEDWEDEIVVNSLSLNYKGERKTMGAVIAATRKLLHSKTPLNINSPHKTINEVGGGKGDGRIFLTPDCVKAIGVVNGEAKLFLEGARVNDDQIPIFNEFDTDTDEPAQTEIEDQIEETESGTKDAIADDSEEETETTIAFEVSESRERQLQRESAKGLDKKRVPKRAVHKK